MPLVYTWLQVQYFLLSYLFSSKMLHRVHQVVGNFLRLLFGAGQIAYSSFISSFSLEIAGEKLLRAVRVNQDSKVAGRKSQNNTFNVFVKAALS